MCPLVNVLEDIPCAWMMLTCLCWLIRTEASSQDNPLDVMLVMSHPRLVNNSKLPLIHVQVRDGDWIMARTVCAQDNFSDTISRLGISQERRE